MSKLDQIRALRESRFSSGGGGESRPATGAKASDASRPTGALMPEGNTGEGQAGVASSPPEAKFDRVAYQREYMRAYRKRKREEK